MGGGQGSSVLPNRLNAPASPQVSGHCVTQRPRVTQVGVLTVTLSPMILLQRVGGTLSVQCPSTAFTAAPERNRGEEKQPQAARDFGTCRAFQAPSSQSSPL